MDTEIMSQKIKSWLLTFKEAFLIIYIIGRFRSMSETPVYRRGVRVGWRTRFETEEGFYERVNNEGLQSSGKTQEVDAHEG